MRRSSIARLAVLALSPAVVAGTLMGIGGAVLATGIIMIVTGRTTFTMTRQPPVAP